jgi:hypothetical protein
MGTATNVKGGAVLSGGSEPEGFDRCTSALLRIVLHVDWVAPETARYDLCCAGRLVSKHTLIAEKAEGHYAHLARVLNRVQGRSRRHDRQNSAMTGAPTRLIRDLDVMANIVSSPPP